MSLPIDLIERAIRPTDAQTAILNDLKAASTQADNILRASCPTEISLTPVARLDAVVKRIQAMSEAVQILRAPLATLYNSLNDDQKDRFAAIGTETKYRRARIAGEELPASDLGGLCKQQTGSFTQVPVQRIEEAIKPTEQQEAAFNALKSASAKAAANLDASCPSGIPETLPGRLDAVAKRLDALVAAVNTVKPELTNFYNSLTDEQKASFNVIGRASPSATPQGETRSGGLSAGAHQTDVSISCATTSASIMWHRDAALLVGAHDHISAGTYRDPFPLPQSASNRTWSNRKATSQFGTTRDVEALLTPRIGAMLAYHGGQSTSVLPRYFKP